MPLRGGQEAAAAWGAGATQGQTTVSHKHHKSDIWINCHNCHIVTAVTTVKSSVKLSKLSHCYFAYRGGVAAKWQTALRHSCGSLTVITIVTTVRLSVNSVYRGGGATNIYSQLLGSHMFTKPPKTCHSQHAQTPDILSNIFL